MIFIEIFRLFGSIFLKSDEADKGLDQIDKKAGGVGSKLGELAGVCGKVALGFAAAGAAAVGGLAIKAVTATDELNKSLNGLQASTDATDNEMQGLRQSMLNIYKNNFGEGFQDIANTLKNVKQMSGESGKSLEDMAQNALMLRDTFEFEVNESTRAASSLMKNFGIDGNQAYNLIAQAAQNGADKNGDLLDTFNEYSVQFKSLGFSAEEFANVLVDGAKNGAFSIDKVGDAVKEFNIRAKDGSKKSSDAFKLLGLDAAEMTESFAKGGAGAQESFQKVVNALSSIKDPVQQNAAGVALFGSQFEDLEKQGILAFANIGNKVSLTKNALDDINSVKYDTFGEALTGIGRNIETAVFIPIGQKLLPILGVFSGWISANMPAIQAVMGTAFNAIGAAMDNISVVALPVLKIGFEMLTNTVVPALMAVFKAWVDNIWPLVADGLKFVTETIMPPLIDIFKFLYAEIVPALAQTFQNWIPTIVSIIKNLWDAIKMYIDYIVAVFKFAWPTIQSVVKIAVDVVSSVIGGLLKVLDGVIKFVKGVFTGDWKTAWEGIKSIFSGIWDGIVGILKGAINLITSGINVLIRGLNKIKFDIPDWVPGIGGKEFGLNIPEIPKLAKGGNITEAGRVLVGENGPEYLDLPQGARVTPLNKSGGPTIIIESPIVTDDYGLDRLMDRITQRMAILGV